MKRNCISIYDSSKPIAKIVQDLWISNEVSITNAKSKATRLAKKLGFTVQSKWNEVDFFHPNVNNDYFRNLDKDHVLYVHVLNI